MELRALKSRIVRRLDIKAPIPDGPSEPVIPEVPPFTAPRTYDLIDTVEGLDHWIEAAYQAGAVSIWVAASAVPERGRRSPGSQWRCRRDWRPICRLAIVRLAGSISPKPAASRSRRRSRQLRPLLEDPGRSQDRPRRQDHRASAVALGHLAWRPHDCTMLMSYVLDGGQFDHEHREPGAAFFGARADPAQSSLIGTGKSLIAFAEVPRERRPRLRRRAGRRGACGCICCSRRGWSATR